MLVLCSTHSQHIRKHIPNNFPHLHNVNRGLQTTKSRKNRKKQLPQEFTKENKQTARKATRQKQKNVHAGLRSMLHATSPLSTPYISPGEHLFTYKASQTKSGNMQNLDRHSFPLGTAANSATVIFGAKLAVTDENLNVYKLADSQNPFSALPI